MKVFRISVAALLLQLCVFSLYAQVEIPVNMYTGTPSITVPIYAITSKDISVPVSLSYSTGAPTQNTPYGAGWSLSAGGSITREVRDYPDDIGGGSMPKKGWFFSTGARDTIGNDTKFPLVDSLTSTTTNEAAAWAKLKGWKNFDTEPDIFNYSFNGISGSFVFDNDLSIRTIPYQDIKIEVATTGEINSITITTNDGYKYTFSEVVDIQKRIYGISPHNYSNRASQIYSPAIISGNSVTVNYNIEWKLTQIESPNFNTVTFNYQLGYTPEQPEPRPLTLGKYVFPDPIYADPVDLIEIETDTLFESTSIKQISSIVSSSGEKLLFEYNTVNNLLTKIDLHDLRRGPSNEESYVKSFYMSYLSVPVVESVEQASNSNYWLGTTHFLSAVHEQSACEQTPPTRFEYSGLVLESEPGVPDMLPAIESQGEIIDAWGNRSSAYGSMMPKLYIYPQEPLLRERYRLSPIPGFAGTEIKLEGGNRAGAGGTESSLVGVLRVIKTPEGGATHFTFGSHVYLDPRTNQELRGGGLRISEINYYDAASGTPVSKRFEYIDPATGKSSGRLLRKPALFMPVYRSGSKTYDVSIGDENWKYLTYRSTEDLTPGDRTQGSAVGYKVVTVLRPGSGKAQYDYDVPAVYGDFVHDKWRATSVKIARPSGTTDLGIVQNTAPWFYPYVPNPEYDYARGLPLKKTEFNEAGKRVRVIETEYQNIFKTTGPEPEKVWGLRFDRYLGTDYANSTYFFGKYFHLTDVVRVPKKEITKVYDLSDVTENTYSTSSVEYIYGSSAHRMVTQVKRTTSDGTVYSSYMKYPKDYTVAISTDAEEAYMIGKLQDVANFRHGVPVEQYETVKKGGAMERVTGGSIARLTGVWFARPMIRSTWSLKASPTIRIDSFAVSSIVTLSGVKKLRMDRRYEKIDSVLSYGSFGELKSSYSPLSRKASSVLYGYGSYTTPVAMASGMLAQVAFSDFETSNDRSFQSDQAYYGSGHTGSKGFYPGVKLYRTDIARINESNYFVSFWAKSATSFTLNVYVKSVDGTTLYTTTPITVGISGTNWKYYQTLVPLGTAPAAFRVELLASSLPSTPAGGPSNGGYLSTLSPVIDDVFFYTETADMSSTTYNFPFGAASSTSSLGGTSYTERDLLGRVTIERDKNRNIMRRTQYNYKIENPLVASFTVQTAEIVTGVEAHFVASPNPCLAASYQWDFGEGAGYVSGTDYQSHTYETPGDYEVKLKVTRGTYTKEYSANVFVKGVIVADICAKGGREFDAVTGVNIKPGTLTYSCSSITTPLPHPLAVIFKATPTNIGDASPSYEWFIKEINGFTWAKIGTGNQYVFPKVVSVTQSFVIKCHMTLPDGREGWTSEMDVIVYH